MRPTSRPLVRPPMQTTLDALRVRYGLDQPMVVQYLAWVGNAFKGDLGMSFEYRSAVADIIWDRLGMTTL